jgi:type IV secretion system protein VirB5
MRPFSRRSARYARTPEPETPYQRAGQAWDERLGSARVQARNWRVMAFGCLVLAAGSTGAFVWRSATGSVTPWIVQVDAVGRAQAIGPAERAAAPADREIAWCLARFVTDVRALPADSVVLRQNWLEAYGFARGDAAAVLNDYARSAAPFSRLGREQVSVEVSSVVRASPQSFRVEWTERRYAGGALTEAGRWTAILGVSLQPPRDPESLSKNPLGVFVTALAWSKELS